tara:strand:- start:2689 stop:3288 length:600 start_codon:yes stop_codon:yes gene_type:complete
MEFVNQIVEIWVAGGWLMIPLAILAFLMYFAIFELWVYFNRNDYQRLDANHWQHWIERPEDSKGPTGNIIRYAQQGVMSESEVRGRVAEIRSTHFTRIAARIRYAAVLVGVAPLMGLLGTVVGMLATFSGLANSVGVQAVDVVAGGISEALITTQTGLILAIPGYVFLSSLRKREQAFDAFLMQVEILTLRHLKQEGRI